MHSLDAFFATVKLPSISQVTQALVKTLNDEDAGVQEVADILAKDPALVAKLLRLANSAQFGLPRGVGSIDEAIQMVGMAKVRSLSLGASLCYAFPPIPGLDAQEFWRSSMACAGYARWLAGGLDMDAGQAWLTGMMLRLGELLIAQSRPEALIEIEKAPTWPGSRWEREKRLIGFSEGQITAELARRWNFPMLMVQALERAYDPLVEQAFSRMGAVIHVAGLLADTMQAQAETVDTLPQDVIAELALDVDWMRRSFPSSDSFINVA